MTLDELARTAPFAKPRLVPAWTLGCFHRRSIAFATGAEDLETAVVWIQSHGLTGDLRIPADRPDLGHRSALSECSREELVSLARAEAGVADTRFDGRLMSWSNWAGFQPYDKYPEPGELRRVGTCMVEFAPSGIYVEDWRTQAAASGLLVGLRLLSESQAGAAPRARGGGLLMAGTHALLVLARTTPLPMQGPVDKTLQETDDFAGAAQSAFDCEGSYLRFDPKARHWRVGLSTNPFLEQTIIPFDEGFEPGPEPGILAQTTTDAQGRPVRRTWAIDTLIANQELSLATHSTPESQAWLQREFQFAR